MNNSILKLPCEVGEVSDGHHTFNELYEHRCILFLALMKCAPNLSWYSLYHDDGTTWDGWFIVGIDLPNGSVTYHLPKKYFISAAKTGAKPLYRSSKWDGHTSNEVLKRLKDFFQLI